MYFFFRLPVDDFRASTFPKLPLFFGFGLVWFPPARDRDDWLA
jgi:hypothetical protein